MFDRREYLTQPKMIKRPKYIDGAASNTRLADDIAQRIRDKADRERKREEERRLRKIREAKQALAEARRDYAQIERDSRIFADQIATETELRMANGNGMYIEFEFTRNRQHRYKCRITTTLGSINLLSVNYFESDYKELDLRLVRTILQRRFHYHPFRGQRDDTYDGYFCDPFLEVLPLTQVLCRDLCLMVRDFLIG